jgi:TonB-linked SusC/RagA family outer membrane protein
MYRTLLAALVGVLLAIPGSVFAQETGTVAGTVVDSTTSETLPGVNVVIEGENLGAATNPDGQFRIQNVPTGEHTLVVSYVGYQNKTRTVQVRENSTTSVRIQLASQAVGLDDVGVTALGIEREERSVGYSVQEVEGADLERAGESNFISSLSGAVAGAQVSSSSAMGGSARIVLRGPGSVSGENQPLIVIDGVPVRNDDFNDNSQAGGFGGYDYGNAASQLNPSEIESVSVLKGASAAALYGSRAANGVIEITTKSGSRNEGIGVTVQQTLTANELYNFPNYQNKYGGGSWSPFSMNDQGQLVADFGTDQSWGPRLDGRQVRQWYSYDDVNGFEGETTPWVAHPNNVENFYRRGLSSNTNVAFSQGGENFNYRTSVTDFRQRGTAPQSRLERQQVKFNGSLDLTDRLTSNASATYTTESARGRPGGGYTNAQGPWLQFNHFGQRQIDLSEGAPMRDITRPDGTQRGWNWIGDPRDGNMIYANNPFWIREKNYQNDDMNRVYGKVSLSYDFTDNLSLTTDAGTDYFNRRTHERIAVGSVEQSEYTEEIRESLETNLGAQLDYNGQITEEISLDAYTGVNYRYENFNRNVGQTQGGLATPEVYTVENSTSRPDITDNFEEQALVGVYGDATFGYQDLIYLGGTLRNDWSSTLPAGENSYLYPSVNTSFVFSSLSALEDSDVLSFGRIRASWSQVGNDTDPYQTTFTYPGGTPFSGSPVQSLPDDLPNEDLKRELKTGWEVGTQLQFFEDRVRLDATYYSEEVSNQILEVQASRASGYESRVVNAGTIANRGIETTLGLTPIQTNSFEWDVTANWARNVNEVVELAEGVSTIPLAGFGGPPFGPDIVAREGEPYGAFFGSAFQRDDNGNKILRSNGTFAPTSSSEVLGTYLPDWTGSVSTSVSYNNLSASVLVDGQKGGQIWSLSNLFGLYSGMFHETAENEIRQVGIIPEGVGPDGNEWTERVDPVAFFQGFFGNHEAHLYDATYIKLREVSVSYRLPSEWFTTTPVQQLSVSIVGRDLATLLKYTPNFDPTSVTRSSGNVQGIEAGQQPPKRSLGFRFRLTL